METESILLTYEQRQTLYIDAIKLINDGANVLSKVYDDNVKRTQASSGFPKEILTITETKTKTEIDTLRKMVERLTRQAL